VLWTHGAADSRRSQRLLNDLVLRCLLLRLLALHWELNDEDRIRRGTPAAGL
jgi:hypothetical protein